jgi:hypothetical protein
MRWTDKSDKSELAFWLGLVGLVLVVWFLGEDTVSAYSILLAVEEGVKVNQ